MTDSTVNGTAFISARRPKSVTLCIETQGREILAGIVHDEVAKAMRLRDDSKRMHAEFAHVTDLRTPAAMGPGLGLTAKPG